MHDALTTYFNGEKTAGALLACLGLIGLAAAALFSQPRLELRSLAATLAVLALVQIAVGAGLYFKTGPQVARLVAQLGSDGARALSEEGARMARVQRNFITLECTWTALLLASAVTAIAQKGRFWVSGVALGVLVNVAVLLAFDLVAERRGAIYLAAIEQERAK
jgi:hypothetical protein